MNKYVKEFLHRGLMFGGFGPIILGIVYAIAEGSGNLKESGTRVLIAIISTYILAFVQAGASVFNQIEHWPIAKSLFFHFSTLYAVYVTANLVNSWIPATFTMFLIFSAIFAVVYLAIWLTVYLCVRATEKRLNSGINSED